MAQSRTKILITQLLSFTQKPKHGHIAVTFHFSVDASFNLDDLFRQNLNGTGTGTIGFIEYYAGNSHCSGTGTGTGTLPGT